MNSPAYFTDVDSNVLYPTGSYILCKSFYPDDLTGKINSNIEYLLPNFNDGYSFEVTASAISPRRNIFLVTKYFPKNDIPPSILMYHRPRSDMVSFTYKNSFSFPISTANNWRYTFIEFGASDEQYFCGLQGWREKGEPDAMLIYNKTNRENSYVSHDLKLTELKAMAVNPADPMSLVLITSLGVMAYRMENDKFKPLTNKFLQHDKKVRYIDVQFTQVGKNSSVLNVLNNNNCVLVFRGDNYTQLQSVNLQDEFSNLNPEYVYEEEKEEDVFKTTDEEEEEGDKSFGEIPVTVTYLKQCKKGFVAATLEGYLIFMKLNYADLTASLSMSLFSVKSVLKFNNSLIVNKRISYIDISPRDTYLMCTMEDGTVFYQNIMGIDSETGKLNIRPAILEHIVAQPQTFSISKHKPVICMVDRDHENSSRLIFKNYMDGGLQVVCDSLGISDEKNFVLRDFAVHISGLMGYAIVNNKLYASYMLHDRLFSKEVKLSSISKYDSKYLMEEEFVRGLEWDETCTRLVVWSNQALYIVDHGKGDTQYSCPSWYKNIPNADVKNKDLIKTCRIVKDCAVGIVDPNYFFFWNYLDQGSFLYLEINPPSLENLRKHKMIVRFDDFTVVEGYRNTYILFGYSQEGEKKRKQRLVCEVHFKRNFSDYITAQARPESEIIERVMDQGKTIAVDTCVVYDYTDKTKYYITGTNEGHIRIYEDPSTDEMQNREDENWRANLQKSIRKIGTYNETRVHQGAVQKLVFIREKENRFLVSLGEEGSVFILCLNYESRGISYKKNLITMSALSSITLVDYNQYQFEWTRAKEHLSFLLSHHSSQTDEIKRRYDETIKAQDERFMETQKNFHGTIANHKDDIIKLQDLLDRHQEILKENSQKHNSNILDLEKLYTKKLENERQKYFDLVNLYKELENKLNIELANQKQNYEGERSEILKEFYREFKKYELELQAKDDYTGKIKGEFRLKEQAIESEHSEEVLLLNKETKRILTETYKDLKFYKDIASKDKRNLTKVHNENKIMKGDKEKHESENLSLQGQIEALKEKNGELEGQKTKLEGELKNLRDETYNKNAKIKELQKAKKMLSEKASELKHLYKDQWEEKMSQMKTEMDNKDSVILENKMDINSLLDKIKKLEKTKECFQEYREKYLGVQTLKEQQFKRIQLEIYHNRMADLAKEQGDGSSNKFTNAKNFLDHLYKTYVGGEEETLKGSYSSSTVKNYDKGEDPIIKHITKELDNERQKNLQLRRQAQKTIEIKTKENKYLINMIKELRQQIAQKYQSTLLELKEGSPIRTNASPTPNLKKENEHMMKSSSVKKLDLSKSESRSSLPKLVKGPTRVSQTGTTKVVESYKWEEMNQAIDNHRDLIYKQKSEIMMLRDKLEEKDHIIMKLMEELQNNDHFLSKDLNDDDLQHDVNV